jgi:serine/threonine protein kinase
MAPMPATVTYKETPYPFKKSLGQGGTGSVGLYGDEKTGYLVLKISFCNDPDGLKKSRKESETALKVASLSPCEAQDVFWRRNATAPFRSQEMIRAPLSTVFKHDCSYGLYEYLPENLAEWLQHNPRRTPEQVVGIFLQIVTILRCLRRKGYYYDDLKPSNILLWMEPGGMPRVKIGDLGGLDKKGEDTITVTPSRLPPKMLKLMSWKNLDVLTSFLLAELIMQLLFRPPRAGERHPMNDFLKCLHDGSPDVCETALIASLQERLAEGLSLKNPKIRDLAALALNFMGYKGLYVSLEDALKLPTSLFTVS